MNKDGVRRWAVDVCANVVGSLVKTYGHDFLLYNETGIIIFSNRAFNDFQARLLNSLFERLNAPCAVLENVIGKEENPGEKSEFFFFTECSQKFAKAGADKVVILREGLHYHIYTFESQGEGKDLKLEIKDLLSKGVYLNVDTL